MTLQYKRRIAFALSMGLVTTGLISFVILSINVGFPAAFLLKWVRTWGMGYMVVVPTILFIGPRVQGQVERLIK